MNGHKCQVSDCLACTDDNGCGGTAARHIVASLTSFKGPVAAVGVKEGNQKSGSFDLRASIYNTGLAPAY